MWDLIENVTTWVVLLVLCEVAWLVLSDLYTAWREWRDCRDGRADGPGAIAGKGGPGGRGGDATVRGNNSVAVGGRGGGNSSGMVELTYDADGRLTGVTDLRRR